MFHLEENDLSIELEDTVRNLEQHVSEELPVFEIGEIETEFHEEVRTGEREYLRGYIPQGVMIVGSLDLCVDVREEPSSATIAMHESTHGEVRMADGAIGRASNASRLSFEESIRRAEASRMRSNQEAWFRLILNDLRGEHYLGQMSQKCANCGALFFREELPRQLTEKKFSRCCTKGKIKLNHFDDYPRLLKDLFTMNDARTRHFRQHIRVYNNSFAMSCMQAGVATLPGLASLTVHGQVYHRYGPLMPRENQARLFAQIYVLDPDEATAELTQNRSVLRQDIVRPISSLLLRKNPLVHSYRMMHEVLKDEEEEALRHGRPSPTIKMTFVETSNLDLRRYNAPTVNELAIVYVEGDDTPSHRELTVYGREHGIRFVSQIDPLCDPMTYPILFPLGTKGWSPDLKSRKFPFMGRKIYMKEYYSYLIHVRESFSPIIHASKLFQQFIVDAHVKLETADLLFHKRNQQQYRMDTAAQLQEFIEQDDESRTAGQKVILPSSFVGGPRAMKLSYHNAMHIVAKTGKPDIFLTMTCNPRWKEIDENLGAGETAIERPDIVARVFKLKVDELKKDITVNNVFGEVASFIYVYEWQKRGLPHVHILITLKSSFKIYTEAQADLFISARIPDPEEDFELYRKVSSHMIHRKCASTGYPGAPCSERRPNGSVVCKKKFPKAFTEVTVIQKESYPTYKRPRNGIQLECDGFVLDNRYVVPYNAYLLKKFNCHMNVEVCSIIHAVKYLYKYVYKGPDRAKLHLSNDNEIDQYVDGRYVCAPEAAHRLFGFGIEEKSHIVVPLHVHLENERMIHFEVGREQEAVERAQHSMSSLEAWFKLNLSQIDGNTTFDSRTLFYHEIPEAYVFNSTHGWTLRKRVGKPVLGRLHFVPPRQSERFYLRILLLNKKGATCYEELRTVAGILYQTYKEAAIASQLENEDDQHFKILEEAEESHMPYQLRSLFTSLLGFCNITNIAQLWERFGASMSEDFVYDGYTAEQALAKAFYKIADAVVSFGIELHEHVTPPTIAREDVTTIEEFHTFRQEGLRLYATLNDEQTVAADEILNGFATGSPNLFFLDGPGGSGKTYLYSTLYNVLRGQNKKVLCVAWTGIAALLLPQGITCHSAFKLPLDFDKPGFVMNPNCKAAANLRETDVFIWDEFSMVSSKALSFVNILLQDVTGCSSPFGGKTIICGGDFRQTLPIVRSNESEVHNSVKCSPLWHLFHQLSLNANMRTNGAEWCRFLKELGSGSLQNTTSSMITLPRTMFTDNVVDRVFGSSLYASEATSYSTRSILAPKNTIVAQLNEDVLKRLQGDARTYISVDRLCETGEFSNEISVEFMNSLNPTGLPPNKLQLKVGAIVMLLRNLDVKNGLTNGTRLIVKSLGRNIIQAEIVTGTRQGEFVIIPRITLICDKGLSITFKRTQFPVKLAFAMTINKSQGQSFEQVGLCLSEAVFSHGQLYVALSRCRDSQKIFIDCPTAPGVLNIVEKSIFC